MNKMLYECWGDLKWEALITWERLTLAELDQVDGSVIELENLIQRKYGYSVWETRKQVTELLKRYDNLAFVGDWDRMKREVRNYWDELNDYDLDYIHCSRNRLLGLLAEKYGKSKGQALEEVDRFLKQFLD